MDITQVITNLPQSASQLQPLISTLQQYGPNSLGIVLPPVIQLLSKDIPADAQVSFKVFGLPISIEKRFIATLTVCALAALIIKGDSIATGNLNQLRDSFLALFTESQLVYRLYFKDSFWSQQIDQKLTTPLSSLGAEG